MDIISKHPEDIERFKLFGNHHLMTIAIMFVLSVIIILMAKKYKRSIKIYLIISLIFMDGSYRLWGGFYQGIDLEVFFTLHLSSAAVILTILTMLHYKQILFDVLVYLALLAVPQAIITPGIIHYGFPHLRFFHILWIHFTVITAVFYMLLIEKHRPSKQSLKRALVVTHIYGVLVFIINRIFDTNYMFIGRKTSAVTVIDYLGPWPYYILSLDLILIITFWLLSLIFKRVFKDGNS
ncbi:MAG: TIGR02206 family membrane protein [Clostridia bacterium]|nr:TIGR02206 family membrane protein [Clostridia bacterium]